ncbi:hypothetical protein [Acidipropionibacterium jensenii]|uniref:hypothetical protein n=1 Tax=Acidipropionibacterium jensenii TaxID=1749 RepID=UPI002649064A|nr:hypothetical protein [Acidipropionibacterium jensenii]MDN5976624.1 hypothetical protein [Acidipropionibacterium jensenii]MDN5995715.1 hypothetical protein [Acidipropionibacterium jensenii]MDN6427173.1 hypothetical protein [Acidipropionibacterium jensenii]MDN6441100.1 hypothetical protein [Acidipropionibacterium jensenii]MDN6479376.1 hypothetical protein [Acidipropionibacterium jensenii]
MDNPIDGHVWKYDPPDEFREFVSGAQKTLVELSACEAIVRKLTCSYNGESKGCPRNYSELAGIVYATAVEKSCPALAIDAVTLWLELQYSKMDSQDCDNLSRFASELYATIAKNLECANDHENAGRAYTSQVESLLRVVSPSYAELLSAEKTLDRAISLRREEGVDKYYTTYTMARLSLRLAGSKGSAAQKQELKRLRHAYRQLGSRKRISRIEQIICLTEMIKSEAQIIRQCRKEIEVAALAEHRSEIRIVTSLDDSDLCSILHSNPRELGVDRTPDWLPSWRDSLNELGERSRTIQETIDELEVLLNGEFNGEGNSILQLAQEAISEVRWTMEPSLRTLHALIEAVNGLFRIQGVVGV